MKIIPALFFGFLAVAATAADNPYNETADAKLDIKQALTQAATTKTPIIIVFGANWCGDCKMLDVAMKNGASAALLSGDFKIVKVNVGHFDKNLDIAKSYAVPLAKGIPAVAIISASNEALYVTRERELANARTMGDKGIYEFFKRVTSRHPSDAELARQIAGAWTKDTFNPKTFSATDPVVYTNTISPDGSFSYIWGHKSALVTFQGTWLVKDGEFIMTFTNSHGTGNHGAAPAAGQVARSKIIHVDEHQFIYVAGGHTNTLTR